MAIDLLNPLDPTSPTFKADVNAFFASGLNMAIEQMNATQAGMSELAAGGAYAFKYIFDSATADADPGPGELRLSSATQSSATVLRIDVLGQNGASLAGVFDTLQAVTSAVKGSVRIVKSADPSRWLLFDVTAVGTGAGYRNMTVVHRAGSAASPLANGDELMVYIDRNGDAGSIVGITEQLLDFSLTEPTFAINFLNVFRPEYDFYRVHLDNMTLEANSPIYTRVASAGVLETGTAYINGGPTGVGSLQNTLSLGSNSKNTFSGVLEFSGTNIVSSRKGIAYRGNFSGQAGSGFEVYGGAYQLNKALSGFQIGAAQNILSARIRVVGEKKQ